MATTPDIYSRVPATCDRSVLWDFLDQSVVHEKAGGLMARELVLYGFFGSLAMVVSALLAVSLPSRHLIEAGGFFLLMKSEAGWLDSFMRGLALPAIGCGVLLLAVDAYLTLRPTGQGWRMVVVAQTALGAAGGTVAVGFVALVVLNLLIWVLIVAAIVMACLALVGLLAAG